MIKKLLTLCSVGILGFATTAAHATTYLYNDLTAPVVIPLGGQGFGSTFTVLSIQASTSPESGCISPPAVGQNYGTTCGGEKTLNGTGTLVTGGDEASPLKSPKNQAPSLADLGVTSASQVGIIWNGGSPGDANLDIPDVSLKLYDGSFNLLLVVSNAFANLNPFPGQGNSGWLLTMNGTAQTAFNGFISGGGTYYLAMDSTFSWPTGSGGSAESYQLANIAPPPSTVPEPSSLLMLGTGIIGAAGMLRRRMIRS